MTKSTLVTSIGQYVDADIDTFNSKPQMTILFNALEMERRQTEKYLDNTYMNCIELKLNNNIIKLWVDVHK